MTIEEKEIEKIKLIIVENLAMYSKAKMPYEEALKMCALGILASGYGNVKQAVKEFAEKVKELYPLPVRDEKELERYMRYKQAVDDLIKELYGEE